MQVSKVNENNVWKFKNKLIKSKTNKQTKHICLHNHLSNFLKK